MTRVTELLKSPSFLVKIVELTISVAAAALFAGVGNVALDNNKLAVVYGTIIGFIMISVITIVTGVTDNGLHRTLVLMISLTAAFLFFASGAIMIESWATVDGVSNRVIGSGIVALVNGLVYLVDLVLTYFRYG